MSTTTISLPQPSKETMKIQHTTHDESRDGLPNPHLNTKRLSASMKVRTFISRRISQTFHSPPLSSHHEEPNPSNNNNNNNRPITQFPRLSESKHSLSEKSVEKVEKPGMRGYLLQKHRTDKATSNQEKLHSSLNSNKSYLPLKSPTGSSSTRSKGFSIPSLKKKGTFSDLVKGRLYRKSEPRNGESNVENTGKKTGEKGDRLVKAYNLRKAMLEGKLERVVPPLSTAISSGQNRRPPPRPAHNPFLNTGSASFSSNPNPNPMSSHPPAGAVPVALKPTDTPSSRTSLSSARPTSTSRNHKTKSASSKIASLIGSSADMLDETRREIQGRFKEPFEYLGYPSFSLARRRGVDGNGDGGESDGDSDESFFCLGDREPGALGLGLGSGVGTGTQTGTGTPKKGERERQRDFYDVPRPKTRGKGSERGGGSRFSNLARGRERDAQIPPEEVVKMCKLCGLGITSSIRGLRAQCEADLLPLNPQRPAPNPEKTDSDSEYGDDDDIVIDDDTEDEVPPTLPLKIRKQVPARQKSVMRKVGPEAYRQRNPFALEDSESDNEPPPPVPPKDDLFLGLSLSNKTYQPQMTSGQPIRQSSQRAKVEVQTEPEPEPQPQSPTDRFSSWHSDGIDCPTYEEAQRILERWSDCFGEEVVEGMRDMQEDGVPLVRAMDCDGVKRDSEFYKFWDEVLREHAPRRSRMAGERSGPVQEYWDG
ncbi:hypothetical protein DL98DRAFT_635909 [Cadophora sp. DSE1049]|nr:hypothetical protein DL98DRAFT_635909 [Cadophora sp. DSE1049]